MPARRGRDCVRRNAGENRSVMSLRPQRAGGRSAARAAAPLRNCEVDHVPTAQEANL